jgi:aminopeptidase N
MLHTLLGAEKFRKGFDLYIKNNDGKAATTKDFLSAMSQASNIDLSQFEKEWYHKAGTPHVDVRWEQNTMAGNLTLYLKQTRLGEKSNFHIPVRVSFISQDGDLLSFENDSKTETVLELTASEQEFKIDNIKKECVPSLFRDFSAPVIINADYSDDDYLLILRSDTDHFNRFSAMQTLFLKEINKVSEQIKNYSEVKVSPSLIGAFESILVDSEIEKAFKAQLISAPSLSYILENVDVYNPELYNDAREFILQQIALATKDELQQLYDELYDNGELDKESEVFVH